MQPDQQVGVDLQGVDLRSSIDLIRAEEYRIETRTIATESRGRTEVVLR